MLTTWIKRIFCLFISCVFLSSVQAQRDSILNKTWIAVMGDIFHFGQNDQSPTDFYCRINYGVKNRFNAFLTDSTLSLITKDEGLKSYSYEYYGDSIILRDLDGHHPGKYASYNHSELYELCGSKKTHMLYGVRTRFTFFDSTYYFLNYSKFKQIEIDDSFRTIKLDSSGQLFANYNNNAWNQTNRVGNYKAQVDTQEINMINRKLHLVKFHQWLWKDAYQLDHDDSRLRRGFTISYEDTVIHVRDDGWSELRLKDKMPPYYSFVDQIYNLLDTISFSDSSNCYLFQMIGDINNHFLIYGTPEFLSSYMDYSEELRHLYRLEPDSFYSPSDSVEVCYFSTAYELDTTLMKLHALRKESLKSHKFKDIFTDYYSLLKTYWAPHQTWYFRPPPWNRRYNFPRERFPFHYKRFLFIKYKYEPHKNLAKELINVISSDQNID